MRVLRARNVNDLFYDGMHLLDEYGVPEPSRAGPVRVAPWPVTSVYERPTERVLFDAKRDANPFFHIMEGLWMLAGRRDSAFLDRYVGTFGARFGEPDGMIHDAYGHRWRHALGFDQLEHVVQTLRRDPGSRQMVLSMWDPTPQTEDTIGNGFFGQDDLRGDWRGRPCLAGDTVLWSPEGDLSIAEIARKFKKGIVTRWPVYSVSGAKMKLSWATDVWKSGRKRTIKLIFDDGSSVRCTPDHTFFKYRGTNVYQTEACDLSVGDRVQARKRDDFRTYERFGRKPVHIQYAELLHGPIPKGHIVHHVDDDKRNNKESNLAVWKKSRHDSHHRMGDNNPMRKLTKAQHIARGKKHSVSLKKFWSTQSEEQRRVHGLRSECTDEGRQRQIAAVTGKKHTLRARELISVAKKKYWKDQRIQNHVVVAIEKGCFEDVYDFTVPGFHTAVIGTGVVTHNCNTHTYFRVRETSRKKQAVYIDQGDMSDIVTRELDMTICCRSNDGIWGAWGANAVHFSMLMEYMAGRIGVQVGTMYQISNNLHVYDTENKRIGPPEQLEGDDPYELGEVQSVPIGTDWDTWDSDLAHFMRWHDEVLPHAGGEPYSELHAGVTNDWFVGVAGRVALARWQWTNGMKPSARATAEKITAPDWRRACLEWMDRRSKK